jgi:hypothetical protein
MTSTTDDQPDNEDYGVCSVCGRSLADNMIPHSDRCDTHHRYHPPNPSSPPLGLTDEEAEHCSASHARIIILIHTIRLERRCAYAA